MTDDVSLQVGVQYYYSSENMHCTLTWTNTNLKAGCNERES